MLQKPETILDQNFEIHAAFVLCFNESIWLHVDFDAVPLLADIDHLFVILAKFNAK